MKSSEKNNLGLAYFKFIFSNLKKESGMRTTGSVFKIFV